MAITYRRAFERQVLDYFRDSTRTAAHSFGNYFPDDMDMYFSLSDYLSRSFKAGTASDLLKRLAVG